jgi:hypothetical protein
MSEVIEATRRWVRDMVIGLNLCPFAAAAFDRLRIVETDAETAADLRRALEAELDFLIAADPAQVETTLLIHPGVMDDFLDYNDFLDVAERAVARKGLDGVVQVASFHPRYQFEGTGPDDVENYTNRSPYPMLHLLREESISRVAGDEAAMADIPERNIATMRALGRAGVEELLRRVVGPPEG